MKMFANTPARSTFLMLTALLAGSILLSACFPAASTTMLPSSTATSVPMATLEPTATKAPVATAIPAPAGAPQLSLDAGSMATGFHTETVAAVSASDNAPFWEVLPEYTRVTLQGYPISNHLMQPQLFIYPVKDLGKVNEAAGQIAASLETLIQSPREATPLPFLPLFNAVQVVHTHLQPLDFKGGRGLRYLTQLDQGPVPINNYEMIYTYQGLTNDGKYYVASMLPVTHPSLPVDGKVTGKEPQEFTADFPTYLANVVKALSPQAANTFTPDLTQLDAMMSSLEIK
jgi:hypothetical protein